MEIGLPAGISILRSRRVAVLVKFRRRMCEREVWRAVDECRVRLVGRMQAGRGTNKGLYKAQGTGLRVRVNLKTRIHLELSTGPQRASVLRTLIIPVVLSFSIGLNFGHDPTIIIAFPCSINLICLRARNKATRAGFSMLVGPVVFVTHVQHKEGTASSRIISVLASK